MSYEHGFLYPMALADSYAMKYEFIPHAQDKTRDDLFHAGHAKYTNYPCGHYTDDTQMTMAHMELMLAVQGKGGMTSLTSEQLVAKWLQAFKRDPHHGYSQRMWDILSQAQSAAEFLAQIDATRGHTSGAAMRAGAFGFIADINEVKRIATLQARITHDTTTGVHSALAVALSVHFLHHGGQRCDLADFLTREICVDWNSAQHGYTDETGNGLKIVTQALRAVVEATSLSDVLLRVVNNDALSDTDTVAAIAMAIASRATDLADDLPQQLRSGLEDGTYGATYLKKLDRDFLTAWPRQQLYVHAACVNQHKPPSPPRRSGS